MARTLTPPDLAHPTSRAERVDHVAALMRAGSFVRGKTSRDLATHWALQLDNVQAITAEASRRVRAEMTSPDETAVYLDAKLREIADDVGAEPKDRVAAMRLLADVTGAIAPKTAKVDVTAVNRDMTPEEARERLKELLPEMRDVLGSGE